MARGKPANLRLRHAPWQHPIRRLILVFVWTVFLLVAHVLGSCFAIVLQGVSLNPSCTRVFLYAI